MTQANLGQCEPCSATRTSFRQSPAPCPSPSSSPCKPSQGDPEGQSALFRTKHGQVAVVQDVYGLLIEYTNRRRSFCPVWPWRTKSREDVLQYVPYEEILCARYLPIRRHRAGLPGHLRKHFLELQVLQRTRSRPCQWSIQRLELSTESLEQAKYWVQQIKQRLQAQAHRPRQLLVFINPYGGRRKARDVWKKAAEPVLTAGSVQCQVIETTCQGHAEGFIKGLCLQQLQQLDGIVAVGGDGMFSELLTGVLQHRHLDAALQLRLAHIPAGSTDAVACTLHGTRDPLTATLHIALGDCTPLDVARLVTLPPATAAPAATAVVGLPVVPAAVSAACGISASSDTMLLESRSRSPAAVASDGSSLQQQCATAGSQGSTRHLKRHKQQQKQWSMHKQQFHDHQQQQQQDVGFQPELRHFVCVANYGFLGDVMETSEELRWMGPIRYDVAGALRWLLLRGYKATVWYKPAQHLAQQQLEQQQPDSQRWQQHHQQQQPEPLVSSTILAPLLHHPQPGFHASAPAYDHQHEQHIQQEDQHCSSADVGSRSSASGGSSRGSFEVQQPEVRCSGAASPQYSLEHTGRVGTPKHHQLGTRHSGCQSPPNNTSALLSVTSEVVNNSTSTTPSGGQHPGGYAGKHVSFDPVVYANAGSVSSITSSATIPAGPGSRASSIGGATSTSSNRCHSKCLLCGAASMQRSNSRSLFVAESQGQQLGSAGYGSEAAAAAAAAAAATADILASKANSRATTPAAVIETGAATAHAVAADKQVAGSLDVSPAASQAAAAVAIAPGTDASPGPEWVKIEGKFASIMCVVTSCRSDKSKSGLMPEAHLSDGRLALVLVEKRSRLQYLRFLIQLASKGIMPDMLPFVRVEYVTDVQVQSEGRQSSWNIDGELLKHSRVKLGVHAGLVDVFARGVEIS